MLLLGLCECKKAADNIFATERSFDIHPNIIFARKISMMHRVVEDDLSRTAKAIPACPGSQRLLMIMMELDLPCQKREQMEV
jgi:hypothetical protein